MAHMNQELKAKLAPAIMSICKEYGIKATLAVRNHSTLILNVKSGLIDFMGQYNETGRKHREENPCHGGWQEATTCDIYPPHYLGDAYRGSQFFSGKALEFLRKVSTAMHQGNWDRSDTMTDYFDVGWYTSINIGVSKDRPYILHAEGEEPEKKPLPKWPILTVRKDRSGSSYCTLTNDISGQENAWPVCYAVKKHGHRCVEKLQELGYHAYYNGYSTVIVTASPWSPPVVSPVVEHKEQETVAKIATVETTTEQPKIVEHTTRKGKVIRGIIRHDLDKAGAMSLDPYTFRKDGGWFIREKHLEQTEQVDAITYLENEPKEQQPTVKDSLTVEPIATITTAKATTTCKPVSRWGNVFPIGAVKSSVLPSPAATVPQLPPVVLFPVDDQPATLAGPLRSCSLPTRVEIIEPPAPKRKAVPVVDLPEKDEQFYPTPPELARDMVCKIKGKPRTILDPSAGKGDLLEKIKDGYSHRGADLYAIEIDNNLRAILQSKKIQVLDSDFLAWSGPDKFDLILMNPPFNRGAEHLLKAIDTMYNGQIVCLLNAETLRNPCTNTRKELARRLEELGAEIEYKPRQFMQAERRTPVDVALINIIIERKVEDDLFEGANDTAETCSETIEDRHEVSTGKRIEELVARYNEVVRLTVETIVNFYRNHNTVGRYIGLNREPTGNWSPKKGYELTAKVQETVNSTVRTIRTDYWRMTLDLPEVKDRMTQKRRKEFEEKLRQNEHMDFTERNIRQFLINLIDGYTKTLEEGVLEVFDRLTIRNSYHEELHTKNIHYFNGWKTNNAYRVGQRVIVPVGGGYDGPFSSWGGKWKLDWTAARSLDDIDLVLSYFNGGREHVKLSDAIKAAFDRGEQSGRSTFFQFKAHKKGTLHLTFLDENILRRFNVAACRGKGWLPGDYGQKPFKDMTPAEKSTVQSFEAGGVEAYNANVGRALFDATIKTIQLLEAA